MQDDARAWKLWIERLAHSEATERFEAIENPPGGVAPEKIVDALIPMLQDDNSLVRLGAAEALGSYPMKQTAVALRRFVDSEEDETAHAYGLSSLGLVGTKSDIGLLLHSVDRPTRSVRAIHALEGLHALVTRLVIDQLIEALTSDRHEVRTSAAGALASVVRRARLRRAEVVEAIRQQIRTESFRGDRSFLEDACDLLEGKGD